jgi:hypothetical protein
MAQEAAPSRRRLLQRSRAASPAPQAPHGRPSPPATMQPSQTRCTVRRVDLADQNHVCLLLKQPLLGLDGRLTSQLTLRGSALAAAKHALHNEQRTACVQTSSARPTQPAAAPSTAATLRQRYAAAA